MSRKSNDEIFPAKCCLRKIDWKFIWQCILLTLLISLHGTTQFCKCINTISNGTYQILWWNLLLQIPILRDPCLDCNYAFTKKPNSHWYYSGMRFDEEINKKHDALFSDIERSRSWIQIKPQCPSCKVHTLWWNKIYVQVNHLCSMRAEIS